MPHRWMLLAALFFLLPPLGVARADENWPRFRGPHGDGAAATPAPTSLSASNLLWKAPLPGMGNGSPILWGDRLFLQAASKDGKQRLFLCLSAKDGKELWRRTLPGKPAQTHSKNSLASGTPATDGHHVVFASWDGEDAWLVSFTLAGKEEWKRNLGPFASNHGAGHSPILHEGRVFFNHDHDDGAALYALDAKSGSLAWKRERPTHKASYATPLVVRTQAGQGVLVASTAGLACHEPATGKVLWTWAWPHPKQPLRMVSSPVLCGDLVVAACGDGAGDRHTLALDFGAAEPKARWQLQRGVPYVPGLIPHEEQLYFVTDQGVAGCLNAKDGKTRWSERLGGAGNVTASPVLAGGHLYQCNEEGELFVFEANPNRFKLTSRLKLDAGVFASPAVGSGQLYIRTRTSLYCLGEAPKRGE